MFSFGRTMEILLFSLCNFAPYVFLSYYIFKKHFRFSKTVVSLVCVVLFLIQFATRYWSALHGISSNVYMSILRLTVFIIGYMILFRQHWGKILFIELIFANLGNFILIAAICLERNLFPHIDHELYCWHASTVMLLLHLVITFPWAMEAKRYFLPMLDNHWIKKEWTFYWIVPFVFYIIWQYQVNAGASTGLENIQNPYNVIFLFIINLGSLFVYYLMIKLDGQLAKNLMLEEQKHYQDIEIMAFQTLQDRMEETRRLRHDMRHHIHTISYYLETKEYDKLENYVNSYREEIPDGDKILFCENQTINNIVFFFATQAQSLEIDFTANLSIPKNIPIAEHDISVLLGNLFENALDACTSQEHGMRRIIVNGKADSHSLLFTIDNTFENELKKNKNGDFITTKINGNGIGVLSAKKIVERYNGIFSAEQKDTLFCVSFMLNF